MSRRIPTVLLAAMITLTVLTGCGSREPQPKVPERPEPPGALIGVAYASGGGMTAHSEFVIRLGREEIVYAAFLPEEETAAEPTEREHVPITRSQWADVEAVILELYGDGALEAYPAVSVSKPKSAGSVLDGGDYTTLSLIWETEGEITETGYRWPGDRRVITLIGLLKELADPQGREIVRYDAPRLSEIYFTRKHRLNTGRDFSFQLHTTAQNEADPQRELIYYLGKYGAVDSGHIRLEESDWDEFWVYAEALQLEYFPEQTKARDDFKCHLSYTDGRYKNVVLNKETEQMLTTYFMNLVQQNQ